MWIIQNTQTELVKQPGRLTPAVCCYLGIAGNWTVTQPAMRFTTRSGDFLPQSATARSALSPRFWATPKRVVPRR